MQENLNWLQRAFQLKGSVIRITYPRILFFAAIGALISWIYQQDLLNHDLEITLSTLPTNVIYNLVLGLLLVFRTNAAYDRFWEGRKAWGSLIINLRILAREIHLHQHFHPEVISEVNSLVNAPSNNNEKYNYNQVIAWLKLIAFSTKHHLRGECVVDHLIAEPAKIAVTGSSELELNLEQLNLEKLKNCTHPPLQIILWLSKYFHQQHQANYIDSTRLTQLQSYLDQIITGITCCERIRDTPLPVAYTILLRRLTLLYCGLISFSLVENLGYWTSLVSGLIAFVLLGVEALATEIENPFGYDDNDLALDDFCRNVNNNIDQTTNTIL